MNAEILKLLLLKNQWILIQNKHLVYVHEANLKRNGNVITFNWNDDSLFTRIFEVANINGVSILKDVKIINPEKVEAFFEQFILFFQLQPNTKTTVGYYQYDKAKPTNYTKNTKYFLLAKDTNDQFLMLNDSTMWRMLSLKHGKFRIPLHENNRSFDAAPESYVWHDGSVELAAERCVSISIPEGFIEWAKQGPWNYFESDSSILEPKHADQ